MGSKSFLDDLLYTRHPIQFVTVSLRSGLVELPQVN